MGKKLRISRAFRDEIGDITSLRIQGSGVSYNVSEATVDFTTGSDLNDYIFTNVQLNHDKDLTAPIYGHLHFFQAQNNMPNFLLQYRWQVNGGAKSTAWLNLKCNAPAFVYSAGTLNQVAYAAPITPPSGSTISDIVQFRILRDNANTSGAFTGSDPYTATVSLMSFDCHFVIDSLGSISEYGK